MDILRYDTHSESKNFVDTMFSMGFVPRINNPTRTTTDNAKCIDNIWSNNVKNTDQTFSGIIIEDISDHLPIFL